jgi:hypothetical protein
MSSQALCLNAASECGADLFLAEGEDGSLDLVLNADDPAAQWHLQPFDSADGAVRYDSTKFYLVNAETGNILQQGKELADKDPGAGEGHAWFRLTAMSATIEHESDAFVFHSLGSSRPADMTSDLTGSSDTRRANGWLAAFQAAEEGLDGLCEFHAEIEGILAMDRTDAQGRAVTTPPATPTSVEKQRRRRRKRRGTLEASAQHLEAQLQAMPHPNLHLGLTLNRDHLPPPPKVRRLLAAAACLLATPAATLPIVLLLMCCSSEPPLVAGWAWQDTRTKEERIAGLLANYVRPPANHWDDWSGPVPNYLRIFIGNATTGTMFKTYGSLFTLILAY